MRRALARRGYADAKPLKRGATGRVYEATRRDDGARCALKMLATRDARDEDATTATTREADALRRCGGHANVIALREAWIDDARGVGWIAMEHGGGDLTTRAATAARAANHAAQIGMALRHVHERCGMVHGDVKPENVLVDEDGMVRLGDFGSARARSDEDGRARAGGTPLYAPPEVCSGEGRACSTAGDMWGLGCVMYQLAAGAPPFDGGDKETLRRNIVETEPPALEGEFAGEYDDVVRALLVKDPARRLTAEQFLSLPYMRERVSRILETSRNHRERASGAVEFDADADADALNSNATVATFGDADSLVERLAALEAKNEVLTMKLEASERARRELCEKLERAMFRVKHDEMKSQASPSTSYADGTPTSAATAVPRCAHTMSFMDSPFIMSSSAERMISSHRWFEDSFHLAPISPIAANVNGARRDTMHAVTPVQRTHDLVSLFEKAEISPAGPLDFESSPGANDSSVMSSPPTSASKSRDEYIDSLLRRARKSRTAEAKTDDASSTYDDAENDPPSPRSEDALPIFESDLATPPTVSRRPKTPMAPLRHQNHRHDDDDVHGDIALGRSIKHGVARERWNVRPRALF